MVNRLGLSVALAAALSVRCGETTNESMPDNDYLTRLSMDLRGVRPTTGELQRVVKDPATIDTLIEAYLDDKRFGARVADLFSEVYLTRTEVYTVFPESYGLNIPYPEFVRSIGDEPLQILAHIADRDLPYTDLVTANWTMANEVLGQIWPVDYPAGATGWKQSRYTDGRPHAGVLSTNSMWWRYQSTDSNANRGRANAVSRILLCNDYLTRPIDFDRNVDLLDQEAIEQAIRNNPACVSCHTSLDPLAGYFYGFWYYTPDNPADVSIYHPEREQRWQTYTGVEPGFYGESGYSLTDLGHQIAADTRFPECMVENAFELLLRRDRIVDDMTALTAHREAFITGDLTVRSLFRSIVTSPEYQGGITDEPGFVSKKMVTPGLLASSVEDLTGFRFTAEGFDLLTTEVNGVLTLAGGADGYYVTQSATDPNVTLLLVQERLAEAAASYAVEFDREHPIDARLFTEIDWDETTATHPDAVVAQIQALHHRLFGDVVAADGEEVEANLALFNDLYEVEGDVPATWVGLLSALLRDPEFLLY